MIGMHGLDMPFDKLFVDWNLIR